MAFLAVRAGRLRLLRGGRGILDDGAIVVKDLLAIGEALATPTPDAPPQTTHFRDQALDPLGLIDDDLFEGGGIFRKGFECDGGHSSHRGLLSA
jgi:hypothetical protein